MTVSKTRGAARKGVHKRIRFGHKLVNIQVGYSKTSFAVHEDLLCSSSRYFKEELQKSRKAIEGDCSVCTEDVVGLAPVSYCKACGQNFHTKCIDDWLQRERKCPLCRLDWPLTQEPSNEIVNLFTSSNWNTTHFDRYMQWLYTGVVPCDEGGLRTLVSTLAFGELLEDSDYMTAVRREIIELCLATDTMLQHRFIVNWYKKTPFYPELRKFLVDLCVALPRTVEMTSELPAQFLLDVTRKLLASRPAAGLDARQALAEYLPEEQAENE